MNWFKANPFLGGLALFTAVAAAAALYFASVQHAAFIEQSDAYANNVSTLNNLQSAKPFPNPENLKAARAEDKRAAEVFSRLASAVAGQTAPLDNSLTPQQFQDQLSEAAGNILAKAQAGDIALPEDFYLGFTQYKNQPPTTAAAPALGQQLASISNVVRLLLESRVTEITSITRIPLPEEAEKKEDQARTEAGKLPELLLAVFDVEFVAEQANFRQALNFIANAQPMVLVRVVSVANSNPMAPSKENPPENQDEPAVAETPGQPPPIPVLFGQENLTVKLRLASVSVSAAAPKE
ncbi:MAG: Amuc_1100 family pilus-like protein [Verrucomicrobia bacterium]|nr:Amuc_1100 family pilus-like protein [Verrucomicrobiota bacterium]